MLLQDPITKQIFQAHLLDDGLHFYVTNTTNEEEIQEKLKAIVNILTLNHIPEDESELHEVFFTLPLNKIKSLFINDLEADYSEIEYPEKPEGYIYIEAYKINIPVIFE